MRFEIDLVSPNNSTQRGRRNECLFHTTPICNDSLDFNVTGREENDNKNHNYFTEWSIQADRKRQA